MRQLVVFFGLVVFLAGGLAQASIVLHDGQEGIVATSQDGWALDSFGRSWNCSNGGGGGWFRDEYYDVPVPVAQIEFWMHDKLITMDNELWIKMGAFWTAFPWPASSVEDPPPQSAGAKSFPNPAPGACRIVFTLPAAGPVSVRLFDAGGRLVRRLIEAPLPVGEYGPTWDGKEDSGVDAAAGVYFFKVSALSGESSGRIVLTR